MPTFSPVARSEDALPNEAMAHPKLTLRMRLGAAGKDRHIEIETFNGADRDFNPVYTTTRYTSLKAALKDIARWHNDRRRKA